METFPCLKFAYRSAESGKNLLVPRLNAANEVAVEAFLAEKIAFCDIPDCLDEVLQRHEPSSGGDPGNDSPGRWKRRAERQDAYWRFNECISLRALSLRWSIFAILVIVHEGGHFFAAEAVMESGSMNSRWAWGR